MQLFCLLTVAWGNEQWIRYCFLLMQFSLVLRLWPAINLSISCEPEKQRKEKLLEKVFLVLEHFYVNNL